MPHLVADDGHQFVVTEAVHQARKNAYAAVGRGERIDCRGFVHFEIERNAVDRHIAPGQPCQPFGVRIAGRGYPVLYVAIPDILRGHPLHLVIAQVGRLEHIDRGLQARMRQAYPGARHHEQVDHQCYDKDFNHRPFGCFSFGKGYKIKRK